MRAFLAAYDPTRYERPSLWVDVALLSVVGADLKALLEATGERPRELDRRPAALYRFGRRSAV